MQAKRHSSLGFAEAVEKGDFFKKDGDLTAKLSYRKGLKKTDIKFKGTNLDMKTDKFEVKKSHIGNVGPNRIEEVEK